MPSTGHDDGLVEMMTASEAGLSWEELSIIILRTIESNGGVAEIQTIYLHVEEQMSGKKLNKQGRDSLRELVNRNLVNKGYIFKYDPKNPGWRITPEGRLRLSEETVGSKPIVDIEIFEGTDKDIDSLIQEQRLRIGCIETGDEIALSRRRQGQERLRKLTLINYSSKCAFCDVNDPSLLVASHIVGWAEDQETRGFLSNIICLCRFHDVLFEKGYVSLADDLAVLKRSGRTSRIIAILLDKTVNFRKPSGHSPKPEFLRRHRLRCGFEQ